MLSKASSFFDWQWGTEDNLQDKLQLPHYMCESKNDPQQELHSHMILDGNLQQILIGCSRKNLCQYEPYWH